MLPEISVFMTLTSPAMGSIANTMSRARARMRIRNGLEADSGAMLLALSESSFPRTGGPTARGAGSSSEHHRNPMDSARATAWARVRVESFANIFLACDFTVSGAMPNDCAIRLFDIP